MDFSSIVERYADEGVSREDDSDQREEVLFQLRKIESTSLLEFGSRVVQRGRSALNRIETNLS